MPRIQADALDPHPVALKVEVDRVPMAPPSLALGPQDHEQSMLPLPVEDRLQLTCPCAPGTAASCAGTASLASR
jgi:hypothetical protein